MLAADYYRVPIATTLGTVAAVLALSIAVSMAFPAKRAG
jgi:hypothetical protein